MIDPTLENDNPSCEDDGAIMDQTDTFDYKCPVCGKEICLEPDWDSMQGGKDYE